LRNGNSFWREDQEMRIAATKAGGVQIAYDVLGTGAPIVMLHDLGESSGFWHEFGYVEGCLAHGRRVVLVDLRGHGSSGKPADPSAYSPIQYSRDVVAVLDDAGIPRADVFGYGLGGRVALCLAGLAPERIHAAAAGGAHPFAERLDLVRDALERGLEHWAKLMEAKAGGFSPSRSNRLRANDLTALRAAVAYDHSDFADGLAGCGVPLLLFLGDRDPRYPLALSFAEESGARVIGLPGEDHSSAARAGLELLPRILAFLERPETCPAARPSIGLWSGCWS
jgi:pimeloyl-ACP methyl ester carboxylesterase